MWDMTHSYVGHDSFICGTWLIHMWDMTHSYVGHDSLICGTWLIHMWDMTRVIWMIHRCDTMSSVISICVTESSICVTRFMYSVCLYIWMCHVHMCDMNHSYVSRDLCILFVYTFECVMSICVIWIIHMCDALYAHVCHLAWRRAGLV